MSQEELFINGDLLRLRRESRGWVLGDLATRACMSVKQIRQLEEGGMSSFYSVAVKATAAKKVAALLGISPEEVFAQNLELPAVPAVSDDTLAEGPSVVEVLEPVTEVVTVPVTQTETEAEAEAKTLVQSVEMSEVASVPEKSKTSLWVIVGLFVAALVVAAYLQPKDEPAAEPAPPLQVVPADPTDAASAADSAGSAASAPAEAMPAASVQKPASATSPVVALSNAPRASAAANASVAAIPAASAASKTP